VPARIGGDEFVVLLAPAGSVDELRALAADVQRALQAPLPIGGYLFSPGVSVGYALSGVNARDPDELIQVADQAMYSAKAERRENGARTHWEELPVSSEPAAAGPDPVAEWEKAMKAAREAVLFEK
jgi:diguanylate cyclase (GGDEF)-like protein